MKKTVILLILCCAYFANSYAQVPAQVVHDPVNYSVSSAIQTLNVASNKIQGFLKDVEKAKLAVEVFDNVKTIQEIMSLIDNLACLTTELRLNIALSNNMSCLTQLNYQLIGVNINYTTEIISKVFLSKNLITMTASDRLRSLNDIVAILQETIKEMSEFNSKMKIDINKKLSEQYTKKRFVNSSGFNVRTK